MALKEVILAIKRAFKRTRRELVINDAHIVDLGIEVHVLSQQLEYIVKEAVNDYLDYKDFKDFIGMA